MGTKTNHCINCGKNIWDGSTHCKSCAQRNVSKSCKMRKTMGKANDEKLRAALNRLYVVENKTQKEIAIILGITSVYYHLKRLGIKKTGKFQRTKNQPSFGWINQPEVRRFICINGKEVGEHRYIMEQYLGRPLHQDEVVHHINEDTLDNRIENLAVMTKGAHISLHHLGKSNKGQITEEGRRKIGEWTKEAWKNGIFDHRPPPSEETKLKISESVKKARANKFWSSKKIITPPRP